MNPEQASSDQATNEPAGGTVISPNQAEVSAPEKESKSMSIGDESMPHDTSTFSFNPPKKTHKWLNNVLFVIGICLTLGCAIYALMALLG